MKFLKFLEKILPLFFWVLIIFAFDEKQFAFLTLLSAMIHELGHAIFGLSVGVLHIFPRAKVNGFRLTPEKMLSYKDELRLIIGGPLFNLIFSLAFFGVYFVTKSDFPFEFALVNLFTLVSNLLPIKGYDGYGILECFLNLRKLSFPSTERLLLRLSFVFISLLVFLSLYFILKFGEGYWIFAVFFVTFFSEITKLCQNDIF